MKIHDFGVGGPVVNRAPHEVVIEYTAPRGGVVTLELYPSSFNFEKRDGKMVDTVDVELPPSGVRTIHREKVTITGSGRDVTIILGPKPVNRRETREFQLSR